MKVLNDFHGYVHNLSVAKEKPAKKKSSTQLEP